MRDQELTEAARRMRVGFDARWYNQSGVGSYIAGLLPALVRAGCELVVYIDPRNPVPGLDKSVQTVPVSSRKYSPLATLEFRRLEKHDKLDLFHCPFYAAPLLRCPIVVTVHDLIPFLFPIYSWPKQKMVRAGYRVMARWAAHFIADSHCTAADLQKILGVLPDRISTVHLAADREIFHPCPAVEDVAAYLQQKFRISKPFIMVASARNWRTKNLESALHALEIAQTDSAASFQPVIYGPTNGLEPFVRTRAPKLNLQNLGYLDAKDLATLFRHAHAFVMPSLYEGFGLPLVEAMSCGCPVIASDRGSLPEIAGDGAQCFDAFDVSAMAGSLLKLLRSPEELQQKRSAALTRAADFSWDKAAQETISVYHHVNRSN